MKELSATSTWQDVTHATIIDKGLPLRKGFGSLSDAIDVGSVSLTLHMESLDAAALLHTSRKQVLIHADGAPIFEGVSFDDADVDLDMNTDYIYASLKFKPYSSLFEQAKVPSDTVLTDVKICDPADAEHSLVHILFGMIIENMPDPLPAIISPSFGITTSVSNTKVLPLVILEKGEGLEDILTSVLYQNGYTYYMEQFSVILIEPYASGREPTSQVPITSILAKPSISQAPYIKETKCSVRFPRVEQYANEVVYELNGDRIEGTDEPSQVQVLEPADYYPTDDEEPATLEADYSTERETDDIELVYVTGATLDVHTRALSGDSTVRVHITAGTHELDPTKARIQLYNNLSYDVSLRNIRVLAGIAYYRNWSALYEDDDATATDTDEIDGLFMPDTATARAFISRYRSEISAEKTSVEFSTHLDFSPGTLIELSGLPYWLLIRSVTDRRDGSDIKDYSCVAYRIHTVATSTRIRVSGNSKVRNAFSPVPVRLFALGNAEAPYEDSVVVADDAMIASDNNAILGASAAWQLTRPTPGAGEYVWYIIGWYTPPSTWPQTWTVPVKDEGLAAYALQLSAPEGTNFYMSGRGVLQTPTLKFTAILSNIPPASVVWTASNGTLIEVEGDAYSRQLDCSTVSQDNVQITISAMVAGQSYSASIGVQRVRETLVTKYFGISNEMLVDMHGEPLASGDTFLYMPKVGEAYDDTNPLFGHVLKWDGDSWESTTDSQSIGFAAKDAFAIARESGKVVFAAVIYTEAMVAANMQVMGEDATLVDYYELLFDGVNDYCTIPAMTNLATLTVEMKVYFNALTDSWLINKRDNASDNQWQLIYHGGTLSAELFGGSTTPVASISYTPLYTNRWYSLAFTTSGVSGSIAYLFVDGVGVNSAVLSGNMKLGSLGITIGAQSWDYSSGNHNGKIKDVRIWDNVRSGVEILANKDAVFTGSETGLIAYYKMDEGTGTTVTDSVGSNNGTIVGATWDALTSGDGFIFRALSDDIGDGSGVPRLGAYYDGKMLWKVDPLTGKIYFGEHFWYDPSDGAIHTPNDKTVIKADGTIEAVDGSFSGDVHANSGFFKGIFDTTALKLEPADTIANNFTQASESNQAQNFFNALSSFGIVVNRFYKASTSISSIQTYARYFDGNWTTTVDLSDLSYIRINNANSSGGAPIYELKLYDSTKTLIPCSTQSVFSGYSLMYLSSTSYIMTTTSFTITVYTGGDKLIVSPEIPDSQTGLADYQIYHSNGILCIKLP